VAGVVAAAAGDEGGGVVGWLLNAVTQPVAALTASVLYFALLGIPVLIFEGAAEVLIAASERALRRELPLAIYTFDMFRTGHDQANRAVVQAVAGADLVLVGIAMHGPMNAVDRDPQRRPSPPLAPGKPGGFDPGAGDYGCPIVRRIAGVRSSPRTSRLMSVPGTRYHKVATASTSPAAHAHGESTAMPALRTSHSAPKTTKVAFMPVDSGGTPAPATTRAHGPSSPACSPESGVM